MIRVVTFDLDDTLWDVRPALLRAEAAQWDLLEREFAGQVDRSDRDRLGALRKTLLAEEPELAHHISRFRERFIERLLLDSGVPAVTAKAAAAEAFATFLAERQQVDVFTHALPTLEALATNYTLGALTNGNAEVRKTPLGPLFKFAFRAEEVGASKPAPALFEAAAKAAGVAPHEIAHVGDHIDHDVKGARAFGARAIWFNPDGEATDEADASVSCLSALPEVIGQL